MKYAEERKEGPYAGGNTLSRDTGDDRGGQQREGALQTHLDPILGMIEMWYVW